MNASIAGFLSLSLLLGGSLATGMVACEIFYPIQPPEIPGLVEPLDANGADAGRLDAGRSDAVKTEIDALATHPS